MPYKKKSDLPDPVQEKLPKHAQDMYQKAYNSAFEQYDDPSKRRTKSSREETAHRVAWSAVKSKYRKGHDGKWHKK